MTGVAEAFTAVAEYALSLGVHDLGKRPGIWEQQVDEHWKIAVNAHTETLETSGGVKVAFGNCYIEFNGWPAGFITPYGGIIAAGELANEQSFIAALRAATRKGEQ